MRLQWSHVLTNVETAFLVQFFREHVLLQWSHVLTNVETSGATIDGIVVEIASMEPRPHERGNQ